MRRARLLVALTCALAGACQDDLDAPRTLAALDRPFFDCRVQPVLTKYCAAQACHGTTERFFHLYTRNRLRLNDDETQRNAFMTAAERDTNFVSAQAVVDPDDLDRSQLLRKPLELDAGGAYHVGATLFHAGNVFVTADDPDFQILRDWVHGATEVPACIEPGSDQ